MPDCCLNIWALVCKVLM